MIRTAMTALVGLTLAGAVATSAHAADEMSPKQKFEQHCSVCHGLDLPRAQRLDLNNWRWVVRDMVDQFGATWITQELQEEISQYLAETYSPTTPR